MAMVPSIRIRAASPSDARAMAELRYQFRASLDPAAESPADFIPRCETWMHQRLGDASAWRCWVAEREAETAGMVWVMILEKLPNPVAEPERHGYVSSLFVKPDLRGQGVGSDLLTTCLAHCESLGCDAVFLWPTARSRSLYLRHGFAVRQDLLERRMVSPPAHS